ncbi:MAG: carboxypeptidase regulatory-like domain-containing protein [Planctomycetes bacterium]|nr:carboxypeptidase regulatory-like domain-containing protein [Planctomycetota bacterium]
MRPEPPHRRPHVGPRRAARLALATSCGWLGCSPPPAPAPPPNCDRPFGRISADHLPIAAPLPADLRQDETEKPYHLLIRTFAFPAGTPLDLDPERIRVLGQPSGRRVAAGEYLFERLPAATANCGVYRQPEAADSPTGNAAPPGGPRTRLEPITMRAPLTLARHCTVVCDLHVAVDLAAARPIDLHGVVVDRESGGPVGGATVRLRSRDLELTTSADGSFRFPEPVRWEEVLTGITIEHDGHFPTAVTERALLSLWVDRFRHDGVAAFALQPDRRGQAPRITIPPLRN